MSLIAKLVIAIIVEGLTIIGLVALLFKVIFWKRKQRLKEHAKKVLKREESEEIIKEKWRGKEKERDEKIREAETIDDVIDLMSSY